MVLVRCELFGSVIKTNVLSQVPSVALQVFGSSFNTNGLGGVLTCGVTGLKAGLSHAPVCAVSFHCAAAMRL